MRHVRLILNHVLNRRLTSASRHFTVTSFQVRNFRADDRTESDRRKTHFSHFTIFGAASLLTSLLGYKKVHALSDDKSSTTGKVYKKDEVAYHNTLEKGVWITYKGKVYDITKFIQHHPGGSHTILMGAGGDVEPFWQTYTVHESLEVQKLLSHYYIGELSAESESVEKPRVGETDGPYANEPIRNPILQILTKEPFNAETPSKLLAPTFVTPADILFVRNHLPVPEVDMDDYKLQICTGSDSDQDHQTIVAEFSLDELKSKFKPVSIKSVIQCSGNRRRDLKNIKEIKGLNWNVGAIGNAEWTGARLVDVLESLNLKKTSSIKHVQLEGLDCDMSGQAYGASISADVALDPERDVILAYEMNGKPLSRDHGFPLRFVAPGVTGARNVKWLSKVILSHEESSSHWQQNDYKSFSPNIDMFNLNYKESISIQEMPVQSAICDPVDGDEIKLKLDKSGSNPVIPLRGYAYSGGGRMIIRVDVSIDGGSSWMTANLDDLPRYGDGTPNYERRNQTWSWMRWSMNLSVPDNIIKSGSGSLEVLCRAFDSSYNSQPERAETVWNVRGVVNNSWHKIKLQVRLE